MKTLRALFLCLMLITSAIVLPLAITAQDTPINVVPATPATEELIEYPFTPVATDPCVDDDPNDLVIPLCATWTPTPMPTQRIEEPAIVNGLWIHESSDFSSSGTCQADYGDNDGPPNYGSEEDIPRVPACISGDNEWLSVNSSSPFPRVMEGVYSFQEMKRELLMTNGETTGSVNVTNRRQYTVISPTVIEFSYTITEEGGCTRTSTMRYRLVEPNDMVCTGEIITPEFTSTSVATAMPTSVSTPQDEEAPQPSSIPQPPVKEGHYIIELPTDDAACTNETLPPGSTIDLSYTSNQDMFINFGGSSYTLFWDGVDYYQYQNSVRFQISVFTSEDGRAYFTWSNRLNPGDEICYVSSDLMQEGAPTPTLEPIEPTSEAYTDVTAMAGSSFNTAWEAPDYLCPNGKTDMLPNLDTAVLTAQADGNFLFTVDGQEYILTNVDGIHGYADFKDDGSMLTIGMNGFYEGEGMGTFGVIDASGEMCIAQLIFTPQ